MSMQENQENQSKKEELVADVHIEIGETKLRIVASAKDSKTDKYIKFNIEYESNDVPVSKIINSLVSGMLMSMLGAAVKTTNDLKEILNKTLPVLENLSQTQIKHTNRNIEKEKSNQEHNNELVWYVDADNTTDDAVWSSSTANSD